MKIEAANRFRKFGIATVIAVYVLILVGGIVRSSGSGMGCPDWPRCFGNWVPPSDSKELPDNYKEIYSEKRRAKNIKLASLLYKIGLDEQARVISGDKETYEEYDYNPVKTWIEYGNRIVGVIIGFLIFLVVIFSVPFLKTDKTVFILSFISFLLVAFEGWLGSIVVSTNLLPFTVTLHMVLALMIVGLLIYVVFRADQRQVKVYRIGSRGAITMVALVFLAMALIQIILGTQVREGVDFVSREMDFQNRGMWLDKVGMSFLIHRSFSILILLAGGWLVYLIRKNSDRNDPLNLLAVSVFGLLLLEVFTGVVLNYLGFPALIQPVHLLIGSLIFGAQFLLMIILRLKRAEV